MPAILCRKIILLIILSYIVCLANVFAQNLDTFAGVNASQNVEEQNSAQPKYAWLTALGEVALINVVVHTFDRFITNEDYAQVSFEDIGNNFRRGFVLDNDDFSMNTFFHPYNGSLYFNAARANGLSFWQSAPYTFAGSLMWEFLGENSAPAINDFISTSIGGIALGEMTHRVSMLALDDSSRGLERACREILAGLISPMDLFNRLLSGKAWRYSPSKNGENVYLKENFQIYLSIFNRFMTDLDHNRDRSNMALGLTAIYGASFTDKERLPYDFFIADIDFNIIGNQPTFAETTIVGALWGKQWEKESNAFFAGIFQHFDYYTSISLTNEGKIPYEFAETASFGGGFYFKRQKNEDNPPVFYGNIHINLVLLGASESDHYSVYERNYNFGSGYSVKLAAIVNLSKYFNVFINAKTYQIFTLNDEEDENYDSIYDEYNVPGNNGNTLFNIFSAGLNYRPIDYWSISVEQRFYLRQSHYKFFKDVLTNSMETRIKLTYSVF